MQLTNKVAIVTGAGHGIGAAIALRLAAHGARVAISYRHDRTGAEALVKAGRKASQTIRAYHIDELSDETQCQQFFDTVTQDFGQIDIVIANAGGAGTVIRHPENLHDLDMEHWRSSLEDNLLVTVTTTKFAIKNLMHRKQGGKIILIGAVSGQGYMGNPAITAYSASKAAVHNFGLNIAKALAPQIIVNVVAPGRCWSKAYEDKLQAEIDAKFAPNRHGRPIESDEIAHAVQMVLENDSIIGQIITVDAGFSLMNT